MLCFRRADSMCVTVWFFFGLWHFIVTFLIQKLKLLTEFLHISSLITHFFYFPTSWLCFQMKSRININFVNDLFNLQSFMHNLPIVILNDWIIWYFFFFYLLTFYAKLSFFFKISIRMFLSNSIDLTSYFLP